MLKALGEIRQTPDCGPAQTPADDLDDRVASGMELLTTKLLTQLAYPLTVAVVSALLGLWLAAGRPVLGRLLIFAAMVGLWVVSTPAFSGWLQATLERRFQPLDMAQVPAADAIVVLGGGISPRRPPTRLSPALHEQADRVWYAARLHRAGKAPVVIASGGDLPWLEVDESAAEATAWLLEQWGVPPSAIAVQSQSRTTREDAVYSKVVLNYYDAEQVLLVTSALHMPRAVATFRAQGIEAIAAPTDFQVLGADGARALSWLPDALALAGTSRACKEYLGLWVYWWRGWLDWDDVRSPVQIPTQALQAAGSA